jgi:hypothetical protein
MEKATLQGGVQMGYTLGQNGAAWPSPLVDPFKNNNRGGFYITQLRVKGEIPFDSTFSAVFVGNLIAMDPQEAYLEKIWGIYTLKAGKFRGVGLKTGSGTDEFERITVNTNRYARYADFYLQTINFRDFGLQLEREVKGSRIKQSLFIHNANRQNVTNDEPSFAGSPATQVLGFDYALDWTVSPYTLLGAQVGAAANREWDEFLGGHDPWEVGYWFKTNALVDASFYHQMNFSRLHILNEASIIVNRNLPSSVTGKGTQIWGLSSLINMEYSAHWGSFFRYEFFDPSDGFYLNDNLHSVTVGGIFHPSPNLYPNLKLTGEYVRTLEEGVRNLVPNDLLYIQFQMQF